MFNQKIGEELMRMYQNEKQRKCSEDIERRFPYFKDRKIGKVFAETMKLPESSNHFQNTYSKNAWIMKNMTSNIEDISDYIRDVKHIKKSRHISSLTTVKPMFNSILKLKKTPKTSTRVLETYNSNLKVA
ncbi:hypothetical protein OAO20_04225 [Candidatus Pelagibacter ubique]|nr:hypothetical protein [Candidatus Pelagibacter ubique]